MFTVTIKDAGVRVDPLTEVHVHLLAAFDRAASACQVPLVITCGREDHPPGDVHTLGQAFDVSVRGLSAPMIVHVKGFLEATLGPLWTVLFECPPEDAPTADEPQLTPIVTINRGATARHLHCQTKKGTIWPSPAGVGVLA
jgi:hypothetical protein